MWIFLNNSFLSIVAHHDRPDLLLVRARVPGDIQRVFGKGKVKIERTPLRDYSYRAEVPRTVVAAALVRKIEGIDYTNFKDSVQDYDRHDFYLRVWSVMFQMQRWWAGRRRGKVSQRLAA
jgi:hypothetical protein